MPAYGPLCTLFHDANQPRASDAEVAWYAKRLPRDTHPVLEAMSGSGRLLLPLVEAGFNVHGVDTSEAMLASCAQRLREAGREAQLFRQNVVALNLAFRYAAAFVAAGSLQLLSGSVAATDALTRIRAHLVEPGTLLLELFVPDQALHPPGAPVVEVSRATLADGSQITLRSETCFDADLKRIEIQNRYERRLGAQIIAREDEKLAWTWYTEDEIVALLGGAGYRDVAIEPPASPGPGARHYGVSARA